MLCVLISMRSTGDLIVSGSGSPCRENNWYASVQSKESFAASLTINRACGEGGPLNSSTQIFERNAGEAGSTGGLNSGTREGTWLIGTAGENSMSTRRTYNVRFSL